MPHIGFHDHCPTETLLTDDTDQHLAKKNTGFFSIFICFFYDEHILADVSDLTNIKCSF